jgi:hypothetical protein
MTDKTSITEMAQFFPTSNGSTRLSRCNAPVKVTAVSSRYWMPGDTYQQALTRQQEARVKLEAKIAAQKSSAADTL